MKTTRRINLLEQRWLHEVIEPPYDWTWIVEYAVVALMGNATAFVLALWIFKGGK
jgi:hypothetical protein